MGINVQATHFAKSQFVHADERDPKPGLLAINKTKSRFSFPSDHSSVGKGSPGKDEIRGRLPL